MHVKLVSVKLGKDIVDIQNYLGPCELWKEGGKDQEVRYVVNVDQLVRTHGVSEREPSTRRTKNFRILRK
jgi:hypothetical protein